MADLTAAELLAIIIRANEENHPGSQAWIDEDVFGLEEVVIDGKLDLVRIAALINEHSKEPADGR